MTGSSRPRPVLLALAPSVGGGGPAGLLPTPDGPAMVRTLVQVGRFGVRDGVVVTRPEWAGQTGAAVADVARVREAATVSAALRCVAEEAKGADRSGVLLVDGAMVAHDGVYDAVLNDPRVASGTVVGSADDREPLLRLRVERGRVACAETAYHRVDRPRGAAAGVLAVAGADLPVLVSVAEELAGLLEGPPPGGWSDELAAKEQRWAAAGHPDPIAARAVATTDVVSFLLMGLSRRGVRVQAVQVGAFPTSRVYAPQEAAVAAAAVAAVDAERLRLAAAVKSRDGFVTTFLVSPYSRHIAAWAARRRLTPNQVTVFSMVLGVVAAALFATGLRWGLVAGAVVLWAAFVADCVDGQLARYTRQFSALGAWLDALFDRAKEFVVFAGLAAGAQRAGDDGTVWLLAAAAVALQVTRHAIAFSYGLSQRPPVRPWEPWPLHEPGERAATEPESTVGVETALLADDQPRSRTPLAALGRAGVTASRFFEQRAWLKWAKRIFVLPIGERFAAIAVTAAVFDGRAVFAVLLVWGGLALAYTVTGRLLRSVV